MKEITQDNYKDLEFNFHGIVIAYPKVDLYFNSEFYFIKQKIDYDTNKRYYITCGYNEEDQTCEGLAPDRLETNIENAFNCWSQMNYYQFENMKEFCEWYLHKDDKLHQAVKQFVKDTQKFYDTPKDLNDKLITECIERRNKEHYFMQKYGFNPYEEEAPEKLCYWDIYNDENCDGELKRIIESKWPKLKELKDKERLQDALIPTSELIYKCISHEIPKELLEQLKEPPAGYVRVIGEDGKPGWLYSPDEIRDKINPGWNTRREKLKDVLKLLELRDLRQNTIDMLVENMPPEKRCFLEKQLERDEKRIEDFLNEVI